MRRTWLFILGLGLASACQSSSELRLTLPPLEDARSLLFAVHPQPVEVWAYDLELDPSPVIQFDRVDDAALVAILSAETLTEMQLDPGVVPAATGERRRKLPIPSERRVYERLVIGSDDWDGPFELVPPAVAGFEVDDDAEEACATWQEVVVTRAIDDRRRPLWSQSVGDTVLIGTDGASPGVHRVVAERVETVELVPPDVVPRAATIHEDEIWVATLAGDLWRGPASSGGPLQLERVPMSGAGERLDDLEVFAGSAGPEVLALDQTRRLLHFDGSTWRVLYEFEIELSASDRNKSLRQLEAGHILAMSLTDSTLVRFRDGAVSLESGSPLPINGYSRAVPTRAFGAVLASNVGTFYHDKNGAWVTLDSTDGLVRTKDVQPFGRGFVFGGKSGNLIEYADGFGFCPTFQLSEPIALDLIEPLDDGFVVTGDNGQIASPVLIVRPE